MPTTKRRSAGLSARQTNRMAPSRFAFPKERKEPLNDAQHVRNAIARFDQVEGVSESERDAAWRRIRAAARKYGVEVEAKGWRSLMKGGQGRHEEVRQGGCVDRSHSPAAAPRWRRVHRTGASHPLDPARDRADPVGARLLRPRGQGPAPLVRLVDTHNQVKAPATSGRFFSNRPGSTH